MALIELEDTNWFPNILRDQQLGYIGWLVQILDIYRPVTNRLPGWIIQSSLSRVHDLCSGSGEPMISLSKSFSGHINVSLSDKFPPEQSNRIGPSNYLPESHDILEIDFESQKYYTMFNAFHHFDNVQQQAIVNQLIEKGAPFCFAEILEPNLFTLIKVILVNTIGQFFLAPFVKPFSIKRLFFTYLLPVNLLTTTYDGIISVLKSKNKKQYQTLLSISSDEYHLEITSLPAPFFNNLIVIRGYPIHPSTI
jgi:hypothetical protein